MLSWGFLEWENQAQRTYLRPKADLGQTEERNCHREAELIGHHYQCLVTLQWVTRETLHEWPMYLEAWEGKRLEHTLQLK